jgi:hypothetical protein
MEKVALRRRFRPARSCHSLPNATRARYNISDETRCIVTSAGALTDCLASSERRLPTASPKVAQSSTSTPRTTIAPIGALSVPLDVEYAFATPQGCLHNVARSRRAATFSLNAPLHSSQPSDLAPVRRSVVRPAVMAFPRPLSEVRPRAVPANAATKIQLADNAADRHSAAFTR